MTDTPLLDPWPEEYLERDIFDESYYDTYYDLEYDEWSRYEEDRKLEEDDRFFERWGYYPDEESAEEADLRIELEEQDTVLAEINSQGAEGASANLGSLLIDALTAK